MSPYKFIDHTADIAVEVEDNSLEELFRSSAAALLNSLVEFKKTGKSEKKDLALSAESIEELLVSFLNELNFLITVKNWIPTKIISINIAHENNSIKLNSVLMGEVFNSDYHYIKEEIKAVTYHQMKIIKTEAGFKTLIVFDI